MSEKMLAVTSFKGTLQECGQAYGEALETEILGFWQQEIRPRKEYLTYAERCWLFVQKQAPQSAEFVRGMAAGAHLPPAYITMLLLHEEFGHMPHCTAFAATGAATEDGKTINAQNWDWPPGLYPWPGLLRLDAQGTLATLTYHFPGLWAGVGLNEAGLSVFATSTGIAKVVSEVGLPTYILVAEMLRRATVAEAIGYMRSVKLAGACNYLLADATGAIAVVETLPGHVSVDQSSEALARANHYEDAETARLAGEVVSEGPTERGSVRRAQRMAELLEQNHGRINPSVAKTILLDRQDPWPWIHEYPGGEAGLMAPDFTLDSMFTVNQDRVFYTCRGGREPGPWQELAF